MRQTVRKSIAIFMTICMLFSLFSTTGLAADTAAMDVVISDVSGMAGSTVTVTLSFENNPGIASFKGKLSYDESLLEFVSVEYNSAFGGYSIQTENGLQWINSSGNINLNDTFATITFRISNNAKEGQKSEISLTYNSENIFNVEMENIPLTITNGSVTVQSYKAGDITNDGEVNMKDAFRLFQYLADYDVEITVPSIILDCNGDGNVNNKDATRLFQYLADWDVILYPIVSPSPDPDPCEHTLTAVEAKAATCIADGNIAYWYCSLCDKCFSDAEGTTEIPLESTVLHATGIHTYVDGVCTGCGKQETVTPPATGEYTITYDIANGDKYLQKLDIQNPERNKTSYNEGDSFPLKDLSVDGYRFIGWFDGAGSNAEQVKKITADMAEDLELYAHWEKEPYTIMFTYSMIDSSPNSKEEEKVKPITYTVDQGATLQPLKLDTYRFIGWSDSEGHLYKDYTIPVGTTGDIKLKDNWVSTRNEAKPKTVLDDPLVVEDTDNQRIYFCYDIGTIENVPLYTTQELLCVNGIITIKEKNTTHKITSTEMNAWGSELSDQTTDSTQFTLSKELSEITEVSERYYKEKGLEKDEAETQAKSQSNTQSYSSSSGGSHEDYMYNDSTTRDSTNESYVVNENFDTGESYELQTGFKNTLELSAGISLPIDILSLNAGVKNTTEISANTDTKSYMDYSVGSTSTWNRDTYDESYQANSSTDNKYWNNSSSKSTEYESSQSKTVTSAIHQLVSEEYGYGKTYADKTGEEESYGKTYAKSTTTNSSTAITFTEEAIESETAGYSTTGYTFGGYRVVMAGTMHVIAVVGYDVASNDYFVYTDMIMGDGTCNDGYHEIIDYSYDRSFTDQQNSVIPFSIPSYVEDYVNTRIVRSEGLEYTFDSKKHTAVVESYNGVDKVVYIPSYVVDEEGSAFKVTGIDSKAFQSNSDIVSISLGRYVSKIPSSAFKGCTALEYVVCPAVTEIGDNAFDGCTSLKEFKISEQITSLGDNAFANVPKILVYVGYDEENPENARQIATAAASSGANSISLDLGNLPQDMELELSVPSGESFVLTAGNKLSSGQLGNRVFTNLTLESHATTTEVKNIEFLNCPKVPLSLYSDNVTLYNVDIENCGYYAMLLANEQTELTLSGTSTFVSSGATAIVCDSVSVLSKNSGRLKVTGDILRCGTVSDSDGRISFVGQGTIKEISREEFEKYKKGMVGQYKISWNTGTGYTISVTRTSSPYGNAETGALESGDAIYYGDVLNVAYTASTGYTLGECGTESITVEKDVTKDDIYASATANKYTYNIIYRSTSGTQLGTDSATYAYGTTNTITPSDFSGYTTPSAKTVKWDSVKAKTITFDYTPKNYTYIIVYRSVNGTQLGTSSATYAYGTTNTITPPSFPGYTTPPAQTIIWDSTTPKTITFTYGIASVSTTPWVASGTWWTPGYGGITYSAALELGTRTGNTIQVRVVWTQTITSAYFGYAQYASAYSGDAHVDWNVAEAATFYNNGRSMTGSHVTYSPWMSVSVSPTQTSASITCYYSDGSGNGGNASSWSNSYAIPTY